MTQEELDALTAALQALEERIAELDYLLRQGTGSLTIEEE